MRDSVTQWIWHDALKNPDWLPLEPKRGERFGGDADCWLCGGPTHGKGWPLSKGLKPTFTDFSQAKAPHSLSVCGACVALSDSSAYTQYAEKTGRPTTFPLKPGKTYARPLNWLYMSHVITLDDHQTPDRKAWRDILLNPPEPPFVMAMAVNGKKHVIFRSVVNQSRDNFVVQADETRVQVGREVFTQMLTEFEEAYALGFSKDSLLTGTYNQASVLKVGVGRWREIEARMERWRKTAPGMMQLAHFCGQKPKEEG